MIKKVVYLSWIFGNSRKKTFLNLSIGYTFLFTLSSVISLHALKMISTNGIILFLDNINNIQLSTFFFYLIFYLFIKQSILYSVFNMQTKKFYN